MSTSTSSIASQTPGSEHTSSVLDFSQRCAAPHQQQVCTAALLLNMSVQVVHRSRTLIFMVDVCSSLPRHASGKGVRKSAAATSTSKHCAIRKIALWLTANPANTSGSSCCPAHNLQLAHLRTRLTIRQSTTAYYSGVTGSRHCNRSASLQVTSSTERLTYFTASVWLWPPSPEIRPT